jgi:hypothetical protein
MTCLKDALNQTFSFFLSRRYSCNGKICPQANIWEQAHL